MTEPKNPKDAETDYVPLPQGEEYPDPIIGLLLDGRYRVETLLARGGMASVYRATDERLGRFVAVKVLHPHLVDSGTFLKRFQSEARSVAQLLHPHLVTVFDQGTIKSTAYIVMELVEGKSLRELINTSAPLSVGKSLNLIKDILSGLAAAHQKGIIHRDIKPENILLDSSDSPKIADFGLAQSVSASSSTSQHSILGTVAYVSPELISEGKSDERGDLYALGIVLYELLTGEVPFSGSVPINVAYAHVQNQVPPPSRKVEWLPTEVDDYVSSLTAREKESRFQNAREALYAIEKLISVLPSSVLLRESGKQTNEEDPNLTARLNVAADTSLLPKVNSKNNKEENPDLLLLDDATQPNKASALINDTQLISSTRKSNSQTKTTSRKWPILIFALLLTAFLALGGTWWYHERGPGAFYTVPKVSGLPLEQAQQVLDKAGLSSSKDEVYSDTVPAGEIVSSLPEEGKKQFKNTPVKLRVSKGIEMFTIPKVIGLSKEKALEEIKSIGFKKPKNIESWSEEVPKDQVINISPKQGEVVRHDTELTLEISKGRQPFTLPELVGKPSSVLEELPNAPFKFTLTEDFSDSVAKGKIISSSPASGTTLYRNSEVKVVVSKGPKLYPVPSVFGKSQKEAKKILENAGFKVKVTKVLDGLFGTARLTRPGAGTMLPKGATVTIVVI
ncbi:Stk1 family PASTA domain-containing Ser/Thr kinase [Actinomycetaceae bacterium TAE3-ERU4]|nr:Stk1 family PASTA domain-containing Ser/Thr kinase [Actinomycetaceae bacterium TAE3-ERU4]